VGIARYKVMSMHRRRTPTPVEPDVLDVPADRASAADGDVDRLADRIVVAQALQELPERVRKSVLLAYVDGLSHRQISERTDQPLGTVKSDIRRALTRMRRDLGAIDG
jgi:RNA polymerase sigma factor (sigma-70 family)